jgi:hypothetical protein
MLKKKERKKETGQKKPGAIGPGKTRTMVLGSGNRVETEPRFSGQKEARAKTNRGPSQTRRSVKNKTLKRTAVSKYPGSTYLSDHLGLTVLKTD